MNMQPQTRQKILLLLLVIVAAYAAYDRFYVQGNTGASSAARQNPKAAFQAQAARITSKVVKQKLNDVELHKVVMAGDDLRDMPFYSSEAPFYLEGMQGDAFTTRIEGQEVVYAGYVEINGRRFAILNSIEYAVGDEFMIEGYRITRIAGTYVVLEKRAEGGLPGARVKVPMAEEDKQPVTVRVDD